jgi:endo-1,4-beta-D-glucanase Y
MTERQLQTQEERRAKLRYWAIITNAKRDPLGYALDVYPEESIRYRASLGRQVLLGQFATRQEAMDRVWAWFKDRQATLLAARALRRWRRKR